MLVTQHVDGPKIVVVGVGFVGSTFAYSPLIRGLAHQVATVDVDMNGAEVEVMDLNQVYPSRTRLGLGGDYSDCEGADTVVIAVDKSARVLGREGVKEIIEFSRREGDGIISKIRSNRYGRCAFPWALDALKGRVLMFPFL